jgi:hypothetical protein
MTPDEHRDSLCREILRDVSTEDRERYLAARELGGLPLFLLCCEYVGECGYRLEPKEQGATEG